MERNPRWKAWLVGVWLSAAVGVLVPASARAQLDIDRGPFGPKNPFDAPAHYGDAGAVRKSAQPDPYGGQLYCPVTGKKLGATEPAVPVQTGLGEKKPSFLGKLRGEKSTAGTVIYVCCPECAKQVQRDPQTYLSIVIADKGRFAGKYTYASAPNQRPANEEPEPGTPPPAAPTGAVQPVGGVRP